MNALIPVFVAILLAEIGGPTGRICVARRGIAAFAMALLISVAVGAGATIAPMMIVPARTLLLGLALVFAGVGQFARAGLVNAHRAPTLLATLLALWRSPAPFLAFAFAAWTRDPLGPAVGALLGIAVATGATALGLVVPRAFRVAAGIILCLAGMYAALAGLRLI